ncbi:MAG: energy transducer TonB [Cyclobacteriaceae bacterium]|nr:energy transducer TonB [Cyclobacteriaceae bacterium]
MTRKSISYFCFSTFALFLLFSCEKTKKETTEASSEANTTTLEAPANTSNTWIDSAEAQNLSNTWVAEEDKGELTNTWAEDAFSTELPSSSSSNSWVDADGETIYKKTEVPPEFVGGKDALNKYFSDNIKYPEDVLRGNVYVAFVVTKEGTIRDARIVKGINENCDKEALRLINNMPAWDPGMDKGKIVSSVYGLPIIFRP